MKILFVSAEVAPFAKVGGLADVAGALPKALKEQGHDVRIVMPLYRMIEEDPRWELATTLDAFEVTMSQAWRKTASFKETEHDGLPIGFIGTDEWFNQSDGSDTIYQPGGMQHLFFSEAVLTAMEDLEWIPDVVHCNDWHTGFLPVLMREKHARVWDQVGTVFTIHNFAYQGDFGIEVLDALDLPRSLYNPEQVEAWGRVNFVKAGCVYADQVNTVSETYAKEIQTPEYGCKLDGLMRHLHGLGRLRGILNGIDTDVFNPATDANLPKNYSLQNFEGKAECKMALLQEVGLKPIKGAPLFGVVTRISSQKGIHLIMEAARAMFTLPVQLIIQGLGEPDMCEALRALVEKYPKHFRYIQRFDAPLAQRVYAGSDAFLMPSVFEPCGLGQMIAMRYGSVPVVRKTGGLADTVFEGHNGFVFDRIAPMDLLAALVRAHEAYQEPQRWKQLVQEGMSQDLTWDLSARLYVRMYQDAARSRHLVQAKTA
ncbi:MAG: glycogen synthase [Fimbriimonas sp.]